MTTLVLNVVTLRYSSWSMRPWLALAHAGASFETRTATLPAMGSPTAARAERDALGSSTGYFPVLHVDGVRIHESLAICEFVAEAFPDAHLWPAAPLDRARARAAACEMLSGFRELRNTMPCHLFARVPRFTPDASAQVEIERVQELWRECLERSGGPFLFGAFGIADAMYFPVLSRFRTYGVALPADLEGYARAVAEVPAVNALVALAREAPRLPGYDAHVTRLRGDPDAALTRAPLAP